MQSLVEALRDVADRLQEQNRRLAGVEMRGKVKEVDAGKALCRIVIGKTDGAEVLSPWVPYKQTAGAVKLHNPPSIGQVMVVRSETGDIEQGLAEPYRWNDDNASPSDDPEEHLLTFGGVTLSMKSGSLVLSVDGTQFSFSGAGLSQTGGSIRHNDIVIDSTHTHTGVMSGPALTGPPQGG